MNISMSQFKLLFEFIKKSMRKICFYSISYEYLIKYYLILLNNDDNGYNIVRNLFYKGNLFYKEKENTMKND